jgi:nucleotide-binding universal stress UspA family protein
MPRILVALNNSCGGEKALEAAVKLAQQDGGRLTAVTVLEQTGNPALDQLTADVKARTRSGLEELLQTAANYARSRGVRLTPILREGHPAETIIRCAEVERSNLLVLGAGGAPDGKNGLGDTADQVSYYSPCTVLIVK